MVPGVPRPTFDAGETTVAFEGASRPRISGYLPSSRTFMVRHL
jgi:hypothetical protein